MGPFSRRQVFSPWPFGRLWLDTCKAKKTGHKVVTDLKKPPLILSVLFQIRPLGPLKKNYKEVFSIDPSRGMANCWYL